VLALLSLLRLGFVLSEPFFFFLYFRIEILVKVGFYASSCCYEPKCHESSCFNATFTSIGVDVWVSVVREMG